MHMYTAYIQTRHYRDYTMCAHATVYSVTVCHAPHTGVRLHSLRCKERPLSLSCVCATCNLVTVSILCMHDLFSGNAYNTSFTSVYATHRLSTVIHMPPAITSPLVRNPWCITDIPPHRSNGYSRSIPPSYAYHYRLELVYNPVFPSPK